MRIHDRDGRSSCMEDNRPLQSRRVKRARRGLVILAVVLLASLGRATALRSADEPTGAPPFPEEPSLPPPLAPPAGLGPFDQPVPPLPPAAAPPRETAPPVPAAPPTTAPPPMTEKPQAATAPPAPVSPSEPLAGFSDGTPFLRSPDSSFVLFPGARLQTDAYVFRSADKTPNNTFLLRSARLELGGWVGTWVYFFLTGEFAQAPPPAAAPVAPANLLTNDDYVAIAPWGNLAVLQVGQFDAPFTLENRVSSKFIPFMERSVTVRAFGIPDNKALGAMIHGFNADRNFYYSVGTFNGDGQNFKNADGHFDWMGRAWVAPLSFAGPGPLHDVEIGASLWTGVRDNTLAPNTQTTQGGFAFFNTGAFTATPTGATTAQSVQLRQSGRLDAFAFELNAPIAHRCGVRAELVWKNVQLADETIASSGTGTRLGGAELRGYALYADAWVWLVGDDRIIGDQQAIGGLPRYKQFGVRPIENGVMLAARYEHLDEHLTEDATATALNLGNKSVGTTRVDVIELGINGWHSKRFRATFNYVFNRFGGDAPAITKLPSSHEQEFLFRLAIAL